MSYLEKEMESTLWAARSLFERGKTAGSSANISFKYEDKIYISASGTCFGTLKADDFAIVDINGNSINGKKPSKELPLHLSFYKKSEETGAVIHTHSFYATLWSCLKHRNGDDVVPSITPYLNMKVGNVAVVPYAPPGSRQLFQYMEERIHVAEGFLLQNHGPIVCGKDIMDAFYRLEEIEESCRICWNINQVPEESYYKINKTE